MKKPAFKPLKTAALDENQAEQARPGHGVPSQNPEYAPQFWLDPGEAEREANSVLMRGGVLAGAATGTAIGVATAGPAGVLVAPARQSKA